MTTTTIARFHRLASGDWGIRGDAAGITPGANVKVAKADGSTSTVTVLAIVAMADTTATATIVQGPWAKKKPRRCQECGGLGRLVRDLEDGAMKHRACCDIEPA